MSTNLPERMLPVAPLQKVIDSLPHDACYFDADENLVFVNQLFQLLCSLPDNAIEKGITKEALLSCIEGANLRRATGHAIETREQHSDARRDPLTRLANRLGFAESLDRYLGEYADSGAECALLSMNLDRFKPVNDTFGYVIGDKVLVEVADRIRSEVSDADLIFYLGGDAFAVLQSGVPQPHGSGTLAKRIMRAVSRPICEDGHRLHVGISVGVAIAPFDAEDAVSLRRDADLALYQAKVDGRNTLRYFEPEMDARLRRRRAIEVELEKALEHGEFRVLYQPVMDIESNRIVSAEALVRWEHPRLGQVSPAQFIPIAEETGIILSLGKWVLRQACLDALSWSDPLRVAVNLSPVQMRDRTIVSTVMETLRETGLSPERLELEVTETALVADADLTIAILAALRKEGVKIAMDDFGTGYSSINYLRRFPFDKIKIDRSFVSGVDDNSEDAALVRMIAALGASLSVATTAEGVETAQEMEMVRAAGCSQIQGYLLSKPITNAAIISMIS